MKKLLAVGVVVVLGQLGTPAAQASSSYTTQGGCYFESYSQEELTNGDQVGVIGVNATTTVRGSGIPGTRVPATVSCKITVNGIDAPGSTFSYSSSAGDPTVGVLVGQNQISYTRAQEDQVRLCQEVVYDGTGESDDWTCISAFAVTLPGDGGTRDGARFAGLDDEFVMASDRCKREPGYTQVSDNTTQGVHSWVHTASPSSSEIQVCFRAESGSAGAGGRLDITPVIPGLGSPGVPTTDAFATSCSTTSPNAVVGSHPLSSGVVAGVPYSFDAYSDGSSTAWLCWQVGSSVSGRLVAPLTQPGLGSPGYVVTFYPDSL